MSTNAIPSNTANEEEQGKIRLDSIIRSDALPDLMKIASHPTFAPFFKNTVQIRAVIDAHVAQHELRWRLGRRQNPLARTKLHEAIDAGVIVPFAPTFLDDEIQEHLQQIADATSRSADDVQREWQEFRKLLHFYRPQRDARINGRVVDPDDLQYIAAAAELGAPIYSMDRHYRQMNAPVISVAIDANLQSYARANSVRIAVVVGSSFSVTLSFEAIKAACRGLKRAAQWFEQLHPAIQFAIIAAGIVAITHPKSRAKLAAFWEWIKAAATPPVLQAMAEVVVQFAEASKTADAEYCVIQASLPKPVKRSALVHARAVCLAANSPLPVEEIARRIRLEGHVSKSRDFQSYLRRVLRSSGQFTEISPGHWAFEK